MIKILPYNKLFEFNALILSHKKCNRETNDLVGRKYALPRTYSYDEHTHVAGQ